MKLHLPLPLRTALLALCAALSLAQADVLNADFTFTETSGAVHSTDVSLDGNNRKYSYTVDIPDGTVYWNDSDENVKMILENMDKVVVRNIYGSNQLCTNESGKYVGVKTDLTVSNCNSFEFSGNHEPEESYANGKYFNFGSLSTSGNVLLKNIGKIKLCNNEGAVVRGGSFTIDTADYVEFSGNTSEFFDEDYHTPSNEVCIVSIKNVKELRVENNKEGFINRWDNIPVYSDCGTLTFNNTTSVCGDFIRCDHVSITNNYDGDDVFTNVLQYSNFTDCGTIEIIGNEGGFSGVDINNVRNGIYIKNNKIDYAEIYAVGSADMKAEYIISENELERTEGGIIRNFRLFEVSKNSIDSSYGDGVDLSNINEVVITENISGSGFDLGSLENINHIIINKNTTESYLICINQLTDVNLLEVVDNYVGYIIRDGKYITAGRYNSQLIEASVSGSADKSEIFIKNNHVITGRTSELALTNMLSLDVSGNKVSHIDDTFIQFTELSRVSRINLSDNIMTQDKKNGYLFGFDLVNLKDTNSITITNNKVIVKNDKYGVIASISGSVSNVKEVFITGNLVNKGTNNTSSTISSGWLSFSDCESIVVQNNGVNSETEASRFIESVDSLYATGGFKASGELEFRGNDRVLIRGNYITTKGGYYLNAVRAQSDVTLKAKEGQAVEIYDSITVSTLNINGDENNEDIFKGNVTISGAHTLEDLKALGQEATKDAVLASRLVQGGDAHVYGGVFTVEEGIQMEFWSEDAFTSEAAATVHLRNSTLRASNKKSAVTIANGVFEGKNEVEANSITLTKAVLSGQNVLKAHTIIASKGEWEFRVGSENAEGAVLQIAFVEEKKEATGSGGLTITTTEKGTLTTGNQTLTVSHAEALKAGQYKLLEFDSKSGTWEGASTVSVTGQEGEGINRPGVSDVYYTLRDDVYTLWYELGSDDAATDGEEERPGSELLWVAQGGVWAEGKGGGVWKSMGSDRDFRTGDNVLFDKAGKVTVEGVVRPGRMEVTLESGSIIFTAKDKGQISGSTSITKMGAGELVLNLANAYTGNTILKEGKLTVGNANALGLDNTVFVEGGTLDLRGLAVRNNITIGGNAALNGASLYAGKLTLESGAVTGEEGETLHLAQDAELMSGSLSHNTSGSGALVKTGAGTVTLSGKKLEHTGGITVEGGTLALNGVTHTGDIQLNGGKLTSTLSFLHGNLTFYAGSKAEIDSLSLTEGDTLTLASGLQDGYKGKVALAGGTLNCLGMERITGDVIMSGGTLDIAPRPVIANGVFSYEFGQLQIIGKLSATEKTTIHLGELALLPDKQRITLIAALEMNKVSVDNFSLPQLKDSRARYFIDNNANGAPNLYLELNRATLTWVPGHTGSWSLAESGEWETTDAPKTFFNLDRVIFENAGAVEIAGEVNPSSIEVKGDENTTFTGKGAITGEASLTKSGAGTLEILTENKEYSGLIHVNEGALRVSRDNSLGTGNINVASGAVLDVVDGKSVSNQATLFDGSTINDAKGGVKSLRFGTSAHATVAGSYTLAAGNTLSIGTAGAAFTGSFTFAGGTLSLGDKAGALDLSAGKVSFASGSITTIDVSGWEGLEVGRSYTLISLAPTGSVESYFTLEGASGSIRYDAEALALVFTLEEAVNQPGGILPGDDDEEDPTLPGTDEEGGEEDITPTPEEPVNTLPAPDKNRNATLQALEAAMSKGQLTGELANLAAEAVTLAAEDPAAAAELLDKLSGAELATAMTSQIVGNLTHLRRLRANMGSGLSVDATGKNAVYLMGFDEQHSVDESEDGRGMKRTEWGGTLGYERTVGQKSLLGLALTSGSADVTPTRGEGYSEDALRVDLYFVASFGSAWQSVTSLGYGTHSFDTTRHLPGLTAKAGMDGASINFQQELSYTIRSGENDSWQPFLSVELSSNSIDAFTESGAGTASLMGESQSAMAVDITLGARYIHSFEMSGARGSVQLQAGVVVSAGDTAGELDLHFSGAPEQGFTVGAAGYDGVGFNLGGGVELPISKSAAVTGSANAILRSGATEYGASVGLRFRF